MLNFIKLELFAIMSCLLRKDQWQVVQTNGLSGGGTIMY